jgi:hypothetical protein
MNDSSGQQLLECGEKLKGVLIKQEKFTLSFGRLFLILLSTILFIVGIGLILFTILSPLQSDSAEVNSPLFSGNFVSPKLNPIEKIDLDKRIVNAKKSFEDHMTDVLSQVEHNTKNLHESRREIEARYDELAVKPENKDNLLHLSDISESMRKELDDSCELASKSNNQQLENIEREINQISSKFEVDVSSISIDYKKEIFEKLDHNAYDICLQDNVKVNKIAFNLRNSYPGFWGLPLEDYMASFEDGRDKKTRLPLSIGNLINKLSVQIDNAEQLDNYVDSLVKYSANLSRYYSSIEENLAKTNRLTSEFSTELAKDVTYKVREHSNKGIKEYLRYKQELANYKESSYKERFMNLLDQMKLRYGLLLKALALVTFFLLFFASERHFRSLRK